MVPPAARTRNSFDPPVVRSLVVDRSPYMNVPVVAAVASDPMTTLPMPLALTRTPSAIASTPPARLLVPATRLPVPPAVL